MVLPKLRYAVEQWDPRQDSVPIHQWTHPWLPLLDDHMEAMWPTVRQRLSQAGVCLWARSRRREGQHVDVGEASEL